jgi:hypothetical protein
MLHLAFMACLSTFSCGQPPALTPAIPTIGMPSGYDVGNRKARRRDRKMGR